MKCTQYTRIQRNRLLTSLGTLPAGARNAAESRTKGALFGFHLVAALLPLRPTFDPVFGALFHSNFKRN